MQYYMAKSGMQMYDLSRAYGLGYITNLLSGKETRVKDMGSYFLIESNKSPDLENIDKLSVLSGEDLNWGRILITTKNRKGQEKKEKGKEKREDIKKFLSEKSLVQDTLKEYAELSQPKFLSSKIDGETLSQALDVGGAKGIREEIKSGIKPIKKQESKEESIRPSSYDEGSQIYITKADYTLSIIGHLHFTIRKGIGRGKDFKEVSIMLNPNSDGVNIGGMGSLKDLKNSVSEVITRSKLGVQVTLSNIAVNIAKKSYEMKKNERVFTPRFSSLIYGVMTRVGMQMKPFGGGVYPLDFLNELIESKNGGEIFETWIYLFNKSGTKGYEDLALSLSEFITCSTIETFERYIKTQLRVSLSKNARLRYYDEQILQEVMNYV